MTLAAAGSLGAFLGERIRAERVALSSRWLARLRDLLAVGDNDVFPTEQLLDHIPALLVEIGNYLEAPEEEEIAANTGVITKARELGLLRHQQRASVDQLLREYEILAEILETFVAEQLDALPETPPAAVIVSVIRRLMRSVRALMRTTVDTFVSEYTTTIQAHADRLGTFHATISHELRSHVGTIVFAARVLERDEVRSVRERFVRTVETIARNADRVAHLIDTLQRLARIEQPLDVPSHQEVCVESIAGEVVRQMREMAEARGVSLRVLPDLPTVVIDPARLELVLLNLVSNAVKYSDPSKAERFVEIGAAPAEEGWRRIFVRDNGIGIPEDVVPVIFERFFRAHPERDAELDVNGSGLGLAIVADCIEALGGSIACESSDRGTTFTIDLPLRPAGVGPVGSGA